MSLTSGRRSSARAVVALAVLAALLSVIPARASAGLTCRGRAVDFAGTSGDDVIDVVADDIVDLDGDGFITIATFDGDDDVRGSAADEVVCLGKGDDFFSGLAGEDLGVGNGGHDRLIGGPHDDTLVGGNGRDEIIGKKGADVMKGGGGADVMDGGEDDDRMIGGGGDDELRGRDGDDFLRGDDGADLLFGGDGNDRILGNDGSDTVYGNDGDDVIRGGAGDDELNGGVGDDRVLGNSGYDAIWANISTGSAEQHGLNRGGPEFDVCRGGDTQIGCESYPGPRDSQEWSPLINEVFVRWGIKREAKVWRAVEIIDCESNGDPFAVNPTSGTTGLFQHRLVGYEGQQYWEARVGRVRQYHSDIEPSFPEDASPYDPEHNAIVAALLLWDSIPGNWTQDGHPNGVWGHWHCGELLGYWD